MAGKTPNYNLNTDLVSDNVVKTIQDIAANFTTIDAQMKTNATAVTTHETASVLDHPDQSVTTAKLALKAVNTDQLADKAVTLPKIDPTLLTNVVGNQNNTFSPNSYSWVATANQQTFTLPANTMYTVGFLWVNVGGIDQTKDAFTATDGVTFTVAEPLTAGTKVDARWFQGQLASQAHHTTHYANGADAIDITQLQNYSQNIGDVTTLPTTSKQVVGAIANNFNQIGNLSGMFVKATDSTYGAKGDGVTNDTTSLQSFLNDLSGTGKIGIVPKGTYMVDAITRLTVPSNVFVIFQEGAVLQAINTNATSYRILYISGANNVILYNPTVIGDRTTNTQTTGEDGHGITITNSSSNIKIYNPTTKNCWGDGFNVTYCDGLYVENLLSDNNRRQGLTIASGHNILINGAVCSNTNGTSPQAGVDIEPNFSTDELDNVVINNLVTKNNAGSGVSVNINHLSGNPHKVSVTINNHKDYGSYFGEAVLGIPQPTTPITGRIQFFNSELYESQTTGILFQEYASINTPVVAFINPSIFNVNSSGYATSSWGSAVKIYRASAQTNTMGNLVIRHLLISDDRTTKLTRSPFNVSDSTSYGFDSILIEAVKYRGITGGAVVFVGITYRDTYLANSYTMNATTGNLDSWGDLSQITMNESSAITMTSTIRSSVAVTDFTVKYIHLGSNGTTILKIVPTGCLILGLTTVAGNYIQTTQKGASITLQKVSSTEYMVIQQTGTWTSQG